MASNYTSNYQLCQWEANDKVLRTEFKGDNQKIDAALKANADAISAEAAAREAAVSSEASARAAGDLYVKLMEVITSSASNQINLNMGGIDLTQYDGLDIRLDPVLGSGYTSEFYLLVNGLTSGYLYGQSEAGRLASIALSSDPAELVEACFHVHLGQCLCGSADFAYIKHEGYPGGLFSGQHGNMYFALELSAAQVTALNIAGHGDVATIPSGTRVRVYGWKK